MPEQDRTVDRATAAGGAAPPATDAYLATLVRVASEAIIGAAGDGTIQSWNPAAARLFGYTAAEVVGQSIALLAPPGYAAEQHAILARLRAGDVVSVETVRRAKDGRAVPVLLNAAPVLDASGQLVLIAATLSDITIRKRAEVERQHLIALAEGSTDFIGLCDLTGIPFYLNQAALDLVGLDSFAQAYHTPVREFFFPEDQPTILDQFFPSVLAQGHGEVEVRFRHFKTGAARWMLYRVFALHDAQGRPVALATVSRDITERKQAEAALRASEERQAFLLKLSDALRPLSDAEEIQLTACRVLGEHTGASRVLYGDVVDDHAVVISRNYVDGVAPIVGRLKAQDFGADTIAAYQRNETVIVTDVATDPRYAEEERRNFAALEVAATASIGLIKAGRWVAAFGMHHAAPRAWTPLEIALLEETAERTWAAVERARAELALRESEAKYRTLFTAMDQGFCLIEKVATAPGQPSDFRYLTVNPAFERHTGMREVVGKTIRELVPAAEHRIMDRYDAVVRTGQPQRFEDYVMALDLWMEAEVFPTPAPGQIAVLFSNVSARKRADAARRRAEVRMQAVANLVPDLLWESDPDGATTWYNQRWLDYTGQTLEQASGWGWTEAIHPDDRAAAARRYRAAVESGTPLRQEQRIRRHDGGSRWFVVNAVPVKDARGRVVKMYGAATDIHDQRLALEAEQVARAAAEAALQTREQFLSIASHELRTPLTPLLGYAGMLRQGLGSGADGRQRKLVETIERQAQRLNTLIGSLLDVSRLQRGQFTLEPRLLDLVVLTEEVVNEFRLMLPVTGGHTITVERPVRPLLVRGDAHRLEEVLHNLLSNAVKYSPDGDEIRVQVSRRGGDAVLEVADGGIGIPLEAQARLFEPFYRAANVGTRVSGFGLGLYIVQEIVQRHGGRVEVESTERQGTTVRVVLPLPAES